MGKNKLARWAELKSFDRVIQPEGDVTFGKDYPVKGKWRRDIFKNDNPVIIELGCGRGEYTIGLSERFPGNNYIGIDIKGSRLWRGAKTANDKNYLNVAFLRTRIEFINSFFAEDEVDEMWITFPDPHAGKKNSNKRLTCPWFLNNYRKFLKNNSIIHLKTDNQELFSYTRKLVEKNNLSLLDMTEDLHSEKSGNEILSIRTHYENQFLEKGLKIYYLSFRLDKFRNIEDAIQAKNK